VPKKRKNKLWKPDKEISEEEDHKGENLFEDNFESDSSKYIIKRKILKTWGFYNEKFKQAWETYVSNAEPNQIGALYIGTVIFVEIVCKYISRKIEKVSLP
jgi:hypothetical protein